MRAVKISLLVLSTILVAACQHYPLNMTEAEWNALSPQQQFKARQKQADLDAVARQQREDERARKATIKAAEDELKAARLRAIYDNPRYGDIQDCRLGKLIVDFHPGWRNAQTTYFSIARTEDKFVPLRSVDGKKSSKLWLHYREDGSSLIACRRKPSRLSHLSRTGCGEYSIGRKGAVHSLNIPDLLRGKLRCRAATETGGQNGTTVIIIQD